jgi:four helix bundle protein
VEETERDIYQLNDNEFKVTVNDLTENYNSNKDFVTLEAWKKCRDVKLLFYKKIIPLLPKEEKYNLDIQIRKCSISITANISEGYGRFHYQEGIQFYRISRASLYELKDHLISCYDLNYISSELKFEAEELIECAKRTLNGYIKFVKEKQNK